MTGPSRWQLLQKLPLFLNNRLSLLDYLHENFGDFVKLPMGLKPSYIVFSPHLAQQILVSRAKKYEKGRTFSKAAAYLGKGLATSEGKLWLTQRRRMNPHFHREALETLSTQMKFCVHQMLERWKKKESSAQPIDLSIEFQRMAMEVVARTLLGSEVQESKINSIIDAFKVALKFTTFRTMLPFDIPESWPLPSNLEFRRAISTIDEIVYEIIQNEAKREKPSSTLLAMLLRSEDPEGEGRMSAEQLRDEVMTMFIGGTDTSGNTLSWTFLNLFRFPEKAKVLEKEINEKMPPSIEEIDIQQSLDLKFTKAFIDETLRLSPQNWVMSRDTLEEDEINGVKIPKGTTVFIGTYRIHRRADLWNLPLEFSPERFLQEDAIKHPLAYFPFGAGPRKCIGFQFAMMEMLLAIPMILKTFELHPLNLDKLSAEPTWSLWIKPEFLVSLKSKN